jgi:ABC-type multidrug transport system permease subunit
MIQLTDNLKLSILILLGTSYVLYQQKPEFMFHEDGSFKSFGLQPNQTPFPFYIVISVVAFTVYYGLLLREGNYI